MKRSRASSGDPGAAFRTGSTGPPRRRKAEPSGSSIIEVTITLSPPAADLAATLLIESGATAIAVTDGARPRIQTHLPDGPVLEDALARVRRYLASLRVAGVDPGPARVLARRYRDRGWSARWKAFFRPIRIGGRLLIKPSWDTTAVKEGDLVVELDPGMAFGTGQHATTRMCLELLEEALREFTVVSSRPTGRNTRRSSGITREMSAVNRPPAVLDVGTGSGLLAIAAMRFGAGTVVAVDIDEVACRIASDNIRRNGSNGRIVVKHGSLEMVGRRAFDVVLANLTKEGLIGLAPRLARSLRPGGALIVSGILRHQERGVIAAFRGSGMRPEQARREREWAALMLRRPVAPARLSR